LSIEIIVKNGIDLGTVRPEMFAQLHSHSAHSLKDGSIPISELVDTQVERGAKAVACTDHGSMTGAWFLYDHIHNVKKYNDVKHIIGLEAYVSYTRDDLTKFLDTGKDLITDKEERANKRKKLAKKYHQILLAKNKTGYFNLVKIHNEAWDKGFYYSPTTTPEIIFEHSEGLIATTTCLGSMWCQNIMSGDLVGAERELRKWKEVFGEDFYVELQPTNNDTQRMVNIELVKLAKRTKTPMIVTNDVHYLNEEDHNFHYMLLNMSNLRKQADGEDVDKQKMWEFGVDDLYLKSLEQMKTTWRTKHKSKAFTESVFDECIINIAGIISKIEDYSLQSEPLLPSVAIDTTPREELSKRAVAGLQEKLKSGVIKSSELNTYRERLIEELKTISALDADDYILLCNEITNYCADNNIYVGQGRGSAGGSLVLYLIGVTGIDPIKHKLMFSRFLNRNRRAKLVM
jgi:DNA polymerase-3 subunit alpha